MSPEISRKAGSMPRVLLHPKTLAKLAPGEWNDTLEPALLLRVRESGARTWAVRFGHGGSKVTLAPADGRKGTYDLPRARKEAEKKAHEIGAVGVSKFRKVVAEERSKAREEADAARAERAAPSFAAHAQRLVKKAEIRESTRRGWDSILKASIVPALGPRKVADIKVSDLERALDEIKARSAWAADSAHKLLTWIFAHKATKKLRPVSPMLSIDREAYRVSAKKGGRRKVVISSDDLKAVWSAAGDFGAYGDAVRLAILTLARRGEIFGAELSEFPRVELGPDGVKPKPGRMALWNIPATRRKNGEPLQVPLSDAAFELVERLRAKAEARGSAFLFPGDSGALLPTSKAWARLMVKAGLSKREKKAKADGPKTRKAWTPHPLRFHDLRRAGRSIMESELEIASSVAEAVVGHLAPALVRVYSPDGPGLPERKRAIDKWAAHLADIVSPVPDRGKVLTGTFGPN